MTKRNRTPSPAPDLAEDHLPTTRAEVRLIRTELKADIRSLKSEMEARFDQSDAKLEKVLAEVARTGVLVEEQNSNNRIVLEALTGLWQRQDRVEARTEEMERFLRTLSRPVT